MIHDEIIAQWTPSKRVFLSRSVFVGLLTFGFIGCFALLMGLPVVVTPLILLISVAYYIFVFDDFVLWNQHRNEIWRLSQSNLALVEKNHPDQTAALPLDRIVKIRRWFWWSLTVRLTNGTSVEMNYLPRSGNVRKIILDTKKGRAC